MVLIERQQVSSLTSIEKRRFEDLLKMSGGYVLDFTNATFAEFIRDNANKDIYAARYAYNGDSKAKRLRAFWEMEDDLVVGRALKALLELWRYQNEAGTDSRADAAYEACQKTVARLLGKVYKQEETVEDFLKKDFGDVSITGLEVNPTVVPVLESRIREATICLKGGASLSSIFMCGSVLEGILLSIALNNPQKFNQSPGSPKDSKTGKVKPFQDWKLCEFIDVSHELGLLRLDVKKFSHALRDFRNYIHPYQQMSSGFAPDNHTAEICFQVLRAAIDGLRRR